MLIGEQRQQGLMNQKDSIVMIWCKWDIMHPRRDRIWGAIPGELYCLALYSSYTSSLHIPYFRRLSGTILHDSVAY